MAYSFNGTSSWVEHSSVLTLDDFSLSFWLRTTTTDQGDMFFSTIDAGTADALFLRVNLDEAAVGAANETHFYVRRGVPQRRGAFLNSAVYDGSWHHHCLTRTDGTTAYYLDGSAQTVNYQDYGEDALGSGTLTFEYPLYMGNHNNRGVDGALYTDCDMAEVSFHDVVLSQGEISAMAAGATATMCRPGSLIRYWPMLGAVGAGSTATRELITGDGLTETSSPETTDHPPVIYPSAGILTSVPSPIAIFSVSTDDDLPVDESPWNITGRGFGAR